MLMKSIVSTLGSRLKIISIEAVTLDVSLIHSLLNAGAMNQVQSWSISVPQEHKIWVSKFRVWSIIWGKVVSRSRLSSTLDQLLYHPLKWYHPSYILHKLTMLRFQSQSVSNQRHNLNSPWSTSSIRHCQTLDSPSSVIHTTSEW